jgi:hypothetical protein
MSFFYNLNKRLADLAAKQDASQLAESKQTEAVKQSPLTQALNEGMAKRLPGLPITRKDVEKKFGGSAIKMAQAAKDAGFSDSRIRQAMDDLKQGKNPNDIEETDYSAKKAAAGKDIGKPGKNFSKIAKSAGARYGSKAAGERVAGAVLNKLRHAKEAVEQEGDVMDYLNDKLKDYDAEQTKEGNAFTGKLKATPKGGKFKLGDKEFKDTSSLEEDEKMAEGVSRKHFQAIADTLKHIEDMDKRRELAQHHASAFKLANPRFDQKRFFQAAGLDEADMSGLEEGYAEMDAWLKSREKEKGTGRFDKKKISTGTVYTRKPETFDDPETDPEATGGAPKRKGRPAGTRRAIGAKHSGTSKLARKDAIAEEGSTPQEQAYSEIVKLLKNLESGIDSSIRNRLMRLVRTLTVSEPVAEKSVSVAQRRAAGIAHAAQKGEISKSELRGASKEMAKMPKGELHKFAATKEKGLPEKVKEEGKPDFLDLDKDSNKTEPMKQAAKQAKAKGKDSEDKVDETTTSGSVATASSAPKAAKGMQFGKGVYESLDSKLENMIAEGMNVSVNVNTDAEGEAQKSITVTATGEEADKLAELLKMAGLQQTKEVCPACGSSDCGCEDQIVDENSPDWPTNTETKSADPELRTYSGGLNGPKSTGQTTIPVIASQLRRQVSMEENVELERSLFKTWKNYKG